MEEKFKCSQCGLDFPASELITYENHHVCAGCKTSFVQRLKEGATLSATTHFGGFWIRFGAKAIDWMILWIAQWAISLVIGLFFPMSNSQDPKHIVFGPGYFLNLFFSITVGIAYNTWLVGKYGATVGKMACGLKVIMADSQDIGYGRAFGRYCAEFLSSIILCIGYIMAGSDKEKRALHDRICNTRVVYK